jgi:hypothetical protein
MYMCDCKKWRNCGWRWENKAIPFHVFAVHCVVSITIITKLCLENKTVGETGVKRDTGSKGTVGGKIVDVNKTVKIFSMLCKSV